MIKHTWFSSLAGLCLVVTAAPRSLAQAAGATASGTVRPVEVLNQIVTGLPRDSAQEIRVLTATFQPGDRTVFHTHPRPVTVYVLAGAFTLEMEGRQPVILRAGQAMVEPTGVRMTGYDRSTTEQTRVVVFYVSEPGAPFLDQLADTSSRPRPNDGRSGSIP